MGLGIFSDRSGVSQVTMGTGEWAWTQSPLIIGRKGTVLSSTVVEAEREELSKTGLMIKCLSVYFLAILSVNGALS